MQFAIPKSVHCPTGKMKKISPCYHSRKCQETIKKERKLFRLSENSKNMKEKQLDFEL